MSAEDSVLVFDFPGLVRAWKEKHHSETVTVSDLAEILDERPDLVRPAFRRLYASPRSVQTMLGHVLTPRIGRVLDGVEVSAARVSRTRQRILWLEPVPSPFGAPAQG